MVHHETAAALWVGYYKVGTGTPSLTWSESVDEALCFGWIDGIRKSVDEQRYKIRFTPRSPKSIWSAVNIKKVTQLVAEGRMQPAGMAAFAHRKEESSEVYAYEQKAVGLKPEYEALLQANEAAWAFFAKFPPSHRRQMVHWVMSAKQEATQRRRLTTLIEKCEKGERF